MNGLTQGLIIALVPIAVLNTGALIFFCGVVVTTLRDHDRRLKHMEKKCGERDHNGRLAGEGFSL